MYQIALTVHIISGSVLFVLVAVLNLRVFGLSQRLLVTDVVRLLLSWTYLSLEVVVFSGFFMFASDVRAMSDNPVFYWKLLLIIANLANTILLNKLCFPFTENANKGTTPHVAVRVLALFSVVLFAALILCGRLMTCIRIMSKNHTHLINYLTQELAIPLSSIDIALRYAQQDQEPLSIILWQYGLVNIEQLEKILDWLDTKG